MLLEIFAEIVLTWSFHECAKFRGSRAIVGLAGRANVPSCLGDIQKVRSLKIPEFCRPLPPCSSLFVFEHLPPPLQSTFILAITHPLPLSFCPCEI